MMPPNLPQNVEDLHCQLAGGTDDEGAEPVVLGPFRVVELFEDGDEEGEGLAASCPGGAEDVFAL
jgi:hypothetical protein